MGLWKVQFQFETIRNLAFEVTDVRIFDEKIVEQEKSQDPGN